MQRHIYQSATLPFTVRLISCFASLICCTLLHADDVEWISTVNGNWNDAANWSSNPNLPGPLDDVTINPTGSAVVEHDSGVTTIQSLDLSKTLLIESASQIAVSGTATFQPGSSVDIRSGASLSAGNIPTLDGVRLSASGSNSATALSIPGISSVTNTHTADMNWNVSGAMGSISLPNLATLTGSSVNFRDINVTASSGGQFDLSGLTNVVHNANNSSFRVTANGAGSFVDISNMTDLSNGQITDIDVGAGSSIAWGNPQVIDGTNITVTGDLALQQVTTFTNGSFIMEKVVGAPDLTNLASVDGSSLTAGSMFAPGLISLPSVTTYTNSSDRSRDLKSISAGSTLDLSNLTTLSGSQSSFADTRIEAERGGQIDLSSLTTINRAVENGDMEIVASGSGSHIDLAAYTEYSSGNITQIDVGEGASMDWSAPTAATGIDLSVGGTLQTSQIESWTNGVVRATNGTSAAPDFQNLTNVDGSTLAAGRTVTKVGQLSLPGVTAYNHNGDRDLLFESSETGSLLNLSAMTTITLSETNFADLLIDANRGGTIDMSNLVTVNKVNSLTELRIRVRGTGSHVDVSGLQGYEDSQVDSIEIAAGSSLAWSNPTVVSNLNLEIGGTLATAQIQSFTQGRLVALNGSAAPPDFSGLTDADGSTLLAGDGATVGQLTLPVLASYENTGDANEVLQSSRSGSILAAPTLTSIKGSLAPFTFTTVSARSGGTIQLPTGTVTIEQNTRVETLSGGTISAGTLELRPTTRVSGDSMIDGNIDLNGGVLIAGDNFPRGTLTVAGQVLARNHGLISIPGNTTLTSPQAIAVQADGLIAGAGTIDGNVEIDSGAFAVESIESTLDVTGTVDLTMASLTVLESYVQDRGTLAGEFALLEVAAGINGQFDTPANAGIPSHMDRGHFLESISQTADSVTIDIYAALPGDANGDKSVDVSDFNIWNANKFTTVNDWTKGDFNDDGFVDVADFNVWNANKFTSFNPNVVPEPASGMIATLLFCASLMLTRRRRTG